MAARQAAKPASRKGATTRKRTASAKRTAPRVPGWLWGLGGLVAGFFLSQYAQDSAPAPLAKVFSRPAPEQAGPSADNKGDGAGSEGSEASEPRMPTFEFYTLLPESEVIAPGSEARNAATEAAPARDPIAEQIARQQAQPAENRQPTEIATHERYMLQAASFREAADARRLAGRLGDFGLMASISKVQAGDGATWHRVQVGPYGDTRELNRAQDLMITQGIEPLTIRLQN
ncbi:SPOR domain-containing protein [Halomonas sp. YLGW01]|uniref:SPOR domain-containing protein n=1 Tax=Halomonas sp. YLGW01 TaxID=2773308 RepID=UPI0017874F88|nr:SPOR domain-containing protein [Halomonas sp. YLGW01]